MLAGASFVISVASASSELPSLPEAPARDIASLEMPVPPGGVPVAAAVAEPVAETIVESVAEPVTAAVGTPGAAATESAEYLVAVGVFADHARADRLVDVLTQAGFSAMQRPMQLRQAQVQQIALGPFFSHADATAELRRLQRLGGYDDAKVIDGASAAK